MCIRDSYIDPRTFQEVGGEVLTLPQRDVAPICLFFPFTGLCVLPIETGRYRELRNRNSTRSELGFGVAAEVPKQDDFVNAF